GAERPGARRPRPEPPAPGAALSPAACLRAAAAGTSAVGGRPVLQRPLPHPPHGPAETRRRPGGEAARGQAFLTAPRPPQAAVGDLARRAYDRRALRADRQD